MTVPPLRGQHQLVTEWSTSDPQIAAALNMILSEPEYSSARSDMEGWLHLFQARLCFMEAERLRTYERDQKRREERAQARREAKAAKA